MANRCFSPGVKNLSASLVPIALIFSHHAGCEQRLPVENSSLHIEGPQDLLRAPSLGPGEDRPLLFMRSSQSPSLCQWIQQSWPFWRTTLREETSSGCLTTSYLMHFPANLNGMRSIPKDSLECRLDASLLAA